jgi:hypothetical protein
MRTVWKYHVTPGVLVPLRLPLGAHTLIVGFQEGQITFWADVDTDAALENRSFQAFYTGEGVPDNARWVGTTADLVQGLVYHLFEV